MSCSLLRSYKGSRSDSDGEVIHNTDEEVWVFPEGLEVSHPVQHHQWRLCESGYTRFSLGKDRFLNLAEGVVTSVENSVATIDWKGIIESRDDGKTWKSFDPDSWEARFLFPAHKTLKLTKGTMVSDYTGHHPWNSKQQKELRSLYEGEMIRSMMPPPPEVLVLTFIRSERAVDYGERDLVFSKLSGEEVRAGITARSTLPDVVHRIRDKLGLGEFAKVKLVAHNGKQLPKSLIDWEWDLGLPSLLSRTGSSSGEKTDQLKGSERICSLSDASATNPVASPKAQLAALGTLGAASKARFKRGRKLGGSKRH